MEERLHRLEQIERIKCLKAKYCLLCDTGYDPDALTDLFTEEGTWDGGELGCYKGRARVHRFFTNMPATMSFAVHHITNAAVDLADDGKTARGTWYLLQTATLSSSNEAVWVSGLYQDDLVLEADGWKFARINISTRFFTPHKTGWADTPILDMSRG